MSYKEKFIPFTDPCVLVRISLNYCKGGKNSSLEGLKALLVFYTSKSFSQKITIIEE